MQKRDTPTYICLRCFQKKGQALEPIADMPDDGDEENTAATVQHSGQAQGQRADMPDDGDEKLMVPPATAHGMSGFL